MAPVDTSTLPRLLRDRLDGDDHIRRLEHSGPVASTGDRAAAFPAEEEAAYHAIRRGALFAVYHPSVVYNPDHPDERRPENHPHVLLLDGQVIGTVRIDFLDGKRAGLRIIAIRADLQRRGHGSQLLRFAEAVAREAGCSEVVLNANPDAVGFYTGNGYTPGPWMDSVPPSSGAVKMGKRIIR